ncbi:hypothetical protein [Aestuariibaculum lutulentum]|uniref:Peptidase A2 domain-containing protein n=1 Tax=Aestuariibaculum lutulentum TaxID=2920935 RepID=A0ABS9RKT6_9FLAO|nr:hypothetical protein [Aestuariibaculum lutulentum]MCH4553558.1 hypothetical protein [Aestuariibaculum lutulentum]
MEKTEKTKIDLKIQDNGFFYFYMDISNPITDKSAFDCKVIIDTGADCSLIKPHLASALEINSYGKTNILNPLSLEKEETNAYKVHLYYENMVIPEVKCLEMKDLTYPADFMIGVDLFKNFDFHWDSECRKAYMVFRHY